MLVGLFDEEDLLMPEDDLQESFIVERFFLLNFRVLITSGMFSFCFCSGRVTTSTNDMVSAHTLPHKSEYHYSLLALANLLCTRKFELAIFNGNNIYVSVLTHISLKEIQVT